MFFTFSKIAWIVLSPLNFITLLLLAGVLFCVLKFKKTSQFFITLSVLLLIVFGVFPTGKNVLIGMENGHTAPSADKLPEQVAGILVLGGSFDTNITKRRNTPSANESIDRVLHGMALGYRYPSAMIIFSGGEGRLSPAGLSEGSIVKRFLDEQHYDTINVFYEDVSKNTYENVKNTHDMYIPLKDENWIVVTSAYHMNRALGVFRAVGWESNLIPWPVDYRTDGRTSWLPDFNVLDNIYMSHLALHEYLGFWAYKLSGKITSP